MRLSHPSAPSTRAPRTGALIVLGIAAAIALLHIFTNNRYGFHRDELQFLSDARHLDWGFVAYPPITPFLERILLTIFGVSLVGLRLFSVLAQSSAVVLTGLMARELGGARLAQVAAALCVALSPLPLFEGTEFQYSSFDYLWWTLIAYLVIRLLNTKNPRWWLAIGATIGIALLTKYTVTFFIAGLVGGLLLTRQRRFFGSPWLYAGIAVALLLFLPNFLWQVHHNFVSIHFLQYIHARDVRQGRADGFLKDQFLICANVFAAPLWIAGLLSLLRNPRYRLLAWMYLIPFALFFLGKGRGYYLAAAYPMLFAAGAVTSERWCASLSPLWSRIVSIIFFTGLTLTGIGVCTVILPLQRIDSSRNRALDKNGDLREEIGWTELVGTVAGIRDSLPAEQQRSLGIVVGNYGEQGAIEILGAPYHLPLPISTVNSAWLRGYPVPPPTTLIVLGNSREDVDKIFKACHLAGHNGNPYGIQNEESRFHPDIFVCSGPRKPWSELWKEHQSFG